VEAVPFLESLNMNPIAASALTLSLLAGEVQASETSRVTVTPNGSQPSAKGSSDW
jgi:hypothetical protein